VAQRAKSPFLGDRKREI